jgi:hypothetical protein
MPYGIADYVSLGFKPGRATTPTPRLQTHKRADGKADMVSLPHLPPLGQSIRHDRCGHGTAFDDGARVELEGVAFGIHVGVFIQVGADEHAGADFARFSPSPKNRLPLESKARPERPLCG